MIGQLTFLQEKKYVFKSPFLGACQQCRVGDKIYYISDSLDWPGYALFVRPYFPPAEKIKFKTAQELLDFIGYQPMNQDLTYTPETEINYCGIPTGSCHFRIYNQFVVDTASLECWEYREYTPKQLTGWGNYNETLRMAKKILEGMEHEKNSN